MVGILHLVVPLLSAFSGESPAAVPAPLGSELLAPTGRGIRANETIEIVTRWDLPAYRILPDFTALDGGGGSPAVHDSANGSYLITYTTGDMAGLDDRAGIRIPITATTPDGAESFTDTRLTVCRNLRRSVPVHVSTLPSPSQPVYRPGDNLTILSKWDTTGVFGFHPVPDYRELVRGFRESDALVARPPIVVGTTRTYTISYRIPSGPQLVADANNIPLFVVGTDTLCSAVRAEIRVNLRRGGDPAPLDHRVLLPSERGIRDGDLVRIYSRWDSSGYIVRADFSALDGSSQIEEAHPDTGTGNYVIDHLVVPMGALPDSCVTVPITASNSLGDSFTDRSFRICRNRFTPPPENLEACSARLYEGRIRCGKERFRSNDSLVVYTRWRSAAGPPIDVIPSFENLVPSFRPEEATIVERGADTVLVVYRLPLKDSNRLAPDGRNIPISVHARDALWGVSEPETIRVELDTTPPPIPLFDPIEEETNVARIRFSGRAPEAARVAIATAGPSEQNVLLRFFVAPSDTSGRFETEVELLPGRNKVGGWSEDELGNKTALGESMVTRYILKRTTTYATPYRRYEPLEIQSWSESEILVEDEGGMQDARIEIYNLEGERIAELLPFESRPLLARFRWDGTDSRGDHSQPGYYLMRVRRISTAGRNSEEVLPLLYRND